MASQKQLDYINKLVSKKVEEPEYMFRGVYPVASESQVLHYLKDHCGVDLKHLTDISQEQASITIGILLGKERKFNSLTGGVRE